MFASQFLQKRTFLSPLARIPTRVGSSHFLQTTWTAPSAMLPGRSRMPPSGLARSRPLRMCRLTVRSPSTRTRRASRSMARIFPRLLALSLLDRSAPATTSTRSPTFSFCMALSRSALPALEHFRSEGDDLHELPGAELAGHRAEDAGPDGLEVLVDQHRRVPVELDEAAVRPPHLALGPDDDRLGHVALLHLAVGESLAHRDHDDVPDAGVLPLGAAEHLDAEHLLGAGVVGDVQHAGHLDHGRAPSLLARPALEHLDHPPALVLAGGPGLGDAHPVTLVEGRVLRVVVVLGVRLVLLAQRQDLPVLAMRCPAPHGHHHRLLHLVAGDDAGARLGAPAVAQALCAGLFRSLGHVSIRLRPSPRRPFPSD